VIIEIDLTRPVPPYEQIRTQIATMIATGVLGSGARLPPIRQLAADLALAPNTVARAYRELEAEGLVTSRVRHGTTVAARSATVPRTEVHRLLTQAAQSYATLAHQLGVTADDAEAAVRAELARARPPRNY